MARMITTLTTTFTPAYYGLLEAAQTIAERHGDDRAMEWVTRVMEADFDLFCRVSVDSKPKLRLIRGGLD